MKRALLTDDGQHAIAKNLKVPSKIKESVMDNYFWNAE
jgi:hypothetical protein